jgi:hypothetical protein
MKMNDFDLVKRDLERTHKGKPYVLHKGNNCVWVTLGVVNLYYFVRDGKIVDVQVD